MNNIRSGQITVLALLLGLLGLTAGLSVISRSFSDLKQISYVDTGVKALAAAEAGLQYVLSLDPATQTGTCATPQTVSLNLSGIQSEGITYSVCTQTATTATIPSLSKDETGQFSLISVNPNTKQFYLFWGGSNPSLEIMIASVQGPNTTLRRYAYNPPGVTRDNGFILGTTTGDPACPTASCGVTGYSFCAGPIPYQTQDQLMRIRALYAATPVTVCATTAGNSRVDMPNDYLQITVTAKTVNNTVKRLQAVKQPASLPAVFDYAIFSRGGVEK